MFLEKVRGVCVVRVIDLAYSRCERAMPKVKLLLMLLGTDIHKLLWKECCKLIREMLPRQCTGAFEGDPVNLSVTVLGDPR